MPAWLLPLGGRRVLRHPLLLLLHQVHAAREVDVVVGLLPAKALQGGDPEANIRRMFCFLN